VIRVLRVSKAMTSCGTLFSAAHFRKDSLPFGVLWRFTLDDKGSGPWSVLLGVLSCGSTRWTLVRKWCGKRDLPQCDRVLMRNSCGPQSISSSTVPSQRRQLFSKEGITKLLIADLRPARLKSGRG